MVALSHTKLLSAPHSLGVSLLCYGWRAAPHSEGMNLRGAEVGLEAGFPDLMSWASCGAPGPTTSLGVPTEGPHLEGAPTCMYASRTIQTTRAQPVSPRVPPAEFMQDGRSCNMDK